MAAAGTAVGLETPCTALAYDPRAGVVLAINEGTGGAPSSVALVGLQSGKVIDSVMGGEGGHTFVFSNDTSDKMLVVSKGEISSLTPTDGVYTLRNQLFNSQNVGASDVMEFQLPLREAAGLLATWNNYNGIAAFDDYKVERIVWWC